MYTSLLLELLSLPCKYIFSVKWVRDGNDSYVAPAWFSSAFTHKGGASNLSPSSWTAPFSLKTMSSLALSFVGRVDIHVRTVAAVRAEKRTSHFPLSSLTQQQIVDLHISNGIFSLFMICELVTKIFSCVFVGLEMSRIRWRFWQEGANLSSESNLISRINVRWKKRDSLKNNKINRIEIY